jgi:hypothetical protein
VSKIRGQPFTCENNRFGTDTAKGHPHGKGHPPGSVLEAALYRNPDCSLWLEHVTEWGKPTDRYWLMWYDKNGNPIINVSAVLEERDLREISKRLADFIRVP